MAAIHFFTESSKLKTQSSSDAYGPVVGSLNTGYRTTLKGFLNADAKAIAVCQCKVYLQPGESSNLVNAVLVPINPMIIENGFTPVKYFVYRGIKKADILDTSNEIIGSAASSNGLVAKLWTNFNILVADKASSTEPITATKPNAKAIGWQYAANPTTDLMEKVIYETDNDHEVISVASGTEIGEFISGNEGFEIVLAERMYLPDLANIRAAETTITATAPSGSDIPGNEPIANMRKREKILNYIDPVAWYNLFHDVGVYDYGNNTLYKGFNDIYNTFLSDFVSANTLYIDIRNDNGYSLNYYKDNEGQTSDADYGMHVQLTVNGVNQNGIEYYTNYWPILTATIPANTTTNFNILQIKFRKLYNPKPIIYADFTHEQNGNNLQQVAELQKFEDESDLANPTAAWSEDFIYEVPNISSLSTAPKQAAWMMKLYNLRKEIPATALPATVIPKDTPFDNIFGPIVNLPKTFPVNQSTWHTFLQKKFIIDPNFAVVGETTVLRSGVDLIFSFNTIQLFTYSKPLGLDQLNADGSNTIPSNTVSANSEYPMVMSDYLTNSIEFQSVELKVDNLTVSGSNISVLSREEDVPSPYVEYFQLQMTMDEYENRIMASLGTLNTYYHEPYIMLDLFNQKTDNNGIHYYDGVITTSGFDNNGNYQRIQTNGGQLYVYTRKLNDFNTTAFANTKSLPDSYDPNAYFGYAELIQYIEEAENVYLKAPFSDNIDEFTTRLRVRYYGRTSTQFYFNAAIPSLDYSKIMGLRLERISLFLEHMSDTQNQVVAYDHLTAQADENLIGDNPSPYLLDTGNSREIDLGHVLYGLQALLYPLSSVNLNTLATSSLFKNTANAFKAYNLEGIHLAGWVADLGTATANYEYHSDSNKVPLAVREYNNIYYPQIPDIDRYFEISAPEADLEGDIDAYGLWRAWQTVLNNNANSKLTNVLKFYYNNSNPSSNNADDNFNCYENRYLIFCLETGITSQISGNNYSWPDYNNLPQNFLNELDWFATFWYDQFDEPTMFKKILNNEVTFKQFSQTSYVLTKFLQWLKPRVSAEQPTLNF